MTAEVIPMNRAERRRLEREEAKAVAKAALEARLEAQKAAAAPPPALDPLDLRTVLLGAAGWSAGHPPFPPGEARDIFRAACDRVAAFLDMELGWPEDPPASGLDLPPSKPRLILPR